MDTIHCFCDQDQCNTRHKLGSYIPTRLPSVECCHCTSRHGEDCDSGCSTKCRGNYCVVDFDGKEQKKHVIERKDNNLHYCYALMHKAYKPFGQEVFKKSSTCEGHYCFISLTTSEIVLESADFKHNYEDHDEFIGAARPRFELQAGCIKVNGDDKVRVGCTVETQGNNSEIVAKHCICDSHLCNFHHLVKGTDDPRPKAATLGTKQVSP
ncbi:unnamed protein product [Caenorhabditis sp. 36 PRJEB53466]|nr:unnamed protein product [Caenorhabditis sp. 36 PRJEB53466]